MIRFTLFVFLIQGSVEVALGLTRQEKILITKFKREMDDVRLDSSFSDVHLMRWLKYSNNNINQAALKFKKHLEWRRVNEIDKILEWESPKMITNEFRYKMMGRNEDGLPIMYLPMGGWSLQKAMKRGMRNDVIYYMIQIFERGMEAMNEVKEESVENTERNSRKARTSEKETEAETETEEDLGDDQNQKFEQDPTSQMIMIVDLEQLSFGQMSFETISMLLETTRVLEDNYPLIAKQAIIINAPEIFSIVFAMMKPIMSAQTLERVQLYGFNRNIWMPKLLKVAPTRMIPKHLGGEGEFDEFQRSNARNEEKSDLEEIDDMNSIEVTVPKGMQVKMDFNVTEENRLLHWSYESNAPVMFSIKYENSDSPNVEDNENEDIETATVSEVKEEVNPKMKERGQMQLKDGMYSFIFDNEFDVVNEKRVRFTATFTTPQ